ncbi:MAG: calcineurin-like phosphoesterase C-terminal domain-containing protein, partial [Prevotella sp.]|nr:calcineurin-like phosphoesterase C-terminal domain-containing protein [Prevotella sp.]
MKKDGSRLTAYDQGLTDAIWAWLQADMAFVPTTTKVMVCAHSPMFRQENGSERTNTAKHGGSTNTSEGGAFGYGDLFDQYGEVHAWAGHTHSTFNYIYGSSHRHKNIQVHTLARSTGELWTNEYLANGTPRGFTVVNVDNGNVTWKFHPTKYLASDHHGSQAPAYTYCDWTYDSSSPRIAIMKDTGDELDEDYQMHAYGPGTYADGDKHVYANVFLWDSLWGNPVFTLNNTPYTMSRIEGWSGGSALATVYDPADKEFRSFYKAHYTMPSSYEV